MVYTTLSRFETAGSALGQPASAVDLAYIGGVFTAAKAMVDAIDKLTPNIVDSPKTATSRFLSATTSLLYYLNSGLVIPHDGYPLFSNTRIVPHLGLISDFAATCGFVAYYEDIGTHGDGQTSPYVAVVQFFDRCGYNTFVTYGYQQINRILIYDYRPIGGDILVGFSCKAISALLGNLATLVRPPFRQSIIFDYPKFFSTFDPRVRALYKDLGDRCVVLVDKKLLITAIGANASSVTGKEFLGGEISNALQEAMKWPDESINIGNIAFHIAEATKVLPLVAAYIGFCFWYYVKRIGGGVAFEQITWIGINASGMVERLVVGILGTFATITPLIAAGAFVIGGGEHIIKPNDIRMIVVLWRAGVAKNPFDIVSTLGGVVVLLSSGMIFAAFRHLWRIRRQMRLTLSLRQWSP